LGAGRGRAKNHQSSQQKGAITVLHKAIVGVARLAASPASGPLLNPRQSLHMTTDSQTLLLVDGSSYLYRAFHAMPDLRVVAGDPTSPATGAIRGMINMMQKLRKDVRADYAVCIFDAKGPTFRDALYPAYKAQRSAMPDDLRSQVEAIHEVVQLMGWKVLSVPGVEADDVIGTLACMGSRQGIEVIISSGDKDLSQLVDQHITVIDTMNERRRDLAGVEAEFGVQMIRAEEKIRAVAAGESEAAVLDVAVSSPLLLVERRCLTYADRPVELRRGLYNTEHHHYRNALN
jgi:hypothetical protein